MFACRHSSCQEDANASSSSTTRHSELINILASASLHVVVSPVHCSSCPLPRFEPSPMVWQWVWYACMSVHVLVIIVPQISCCQLMDKDILCVNQLLSRHALRGQDACLCRHASSCWVSCVSLAQHSLKRVFANVWAMLALCYPSCHGPVGLMLLNWSINVWNRTNVPGALLHSQLLTFTKSQRTPTSPVVAPNRS